MLPCSDRNVSVLRSKYLPSHNRGIPVPKEPTTIGGHLRKQRLQLKISQSEAAHRLQVSTVTLSRWECDRLYPTWSHWQRIIVYLGIDPFTNPALGRPKGNESQTVAYLSSSPANSLGQRIIARRLALRKSCTECAKELGVCVKTLHGWEAGRHRPSRRLAQQVETFFGLQRVTSTSCRILAG